VPEKKAGAIFRRVLLVGLVSATLLHVGCTRTDDGAKAAKARRDLTEIAAAIEAFKVHYGDYPAIPVDGFGQSTGFSSQRLWAALDGRRGLGPSDSGPSPRGRIFTDRLVGVETALAGDGYDHTHARQLVDPWGRPYHYFYWPDIPGRRFTLYSDGPDGDAIRDHPDKMDLKRDGVLVNADNILFYRDS